MRRKVFTLFLVLAIFFSVQTVFAGGTWFYGTMVGSGKQHVIYENKSFATSIEKFANSPLGWVTAARLLEPAIERFILIPKTWEMKSQEVEMMKIQVKKARALSEIEIQKARKELEFLYSSSKKWRNTPRGKKFLVDLSTQVQSRAPTTYYYFDTGN